MSAKRSRCWSYVKGLTHEPSSQPAQSPPEPYSVYRVKYKLLCPDESSDSVPNHTLTCDRERDEQHRKPKECDIRDKSYCHSCIEIEESGNGNIYKAKSRTGSKMYDTT